MMELVILIGLQGSGKSSFRRTRFSETHICVSKDDFPNARNRNRRQRRMIEEAFAEGRSVVVDNTNPTITDRAELIALAREFQARVIGYYFESIVADCRRRNAQREGMARVPDIAIFTTIKKLQRPSYGEGFDKLYYVRLVDNSEFEISDWNADAE
jgi:predicted kinase